MATKDDGIVTAAVTIVVLITASPANGNVNVLASPHILALDNKEAKIEIGEEVPVAT